MARLITNLDVREINHALLGILKEARAARTQGTDSPTPETCRSGGTTLISGGSEGEVTTVPRTLMLVATNEDGTVRTDSEGYALMESVAIKEPV